MNVLSGSRVGLLFPVECVLKRHETGDHGGWQLTKQQSKELF